MSKYVQKTRVMVNGKDVSDLVIRAKLDRDSKSIETVDLTMTVSKLDVDSGVLVVYVGSEDES